MTEAGPVPAWAPWPPLRVPAMRAAVSPPSRSGRRAAGFTLLEVLVAVAAVALLSGALLAMYLSYVQGLQRVETQRRLNLLRDGLAAYYRAQTFLVESSASAQLRTSDATAIADGAILSAADLTPIQGYFARYAPSDLHRDGYGQPIRIMVSTPRSQQAMGIALVYRRIALVSAGPNQRFDTPPWNPDEALAQRAGDDEVVVLDTWSEQADLLQRTDERMHKLADALHAYAQGRYLLDVNRDPLIDYFGQSATTTNDPNPDRFDPDGAILRGSSRGSTVLTDAELAALQLTRDDATGAWGQDLRFENDTTMVRSPAHEPPDNFPPYTARVVVALPGRADYQQLIIGAF